MKFGFRLCSLLMLAAVVCQLCSCGTEKLVINSCPFDELEAKEIDIQWLRNRHYADETNCYNGPKYEVYLRDGELALREHVRKNAMAFNMDYRYLLGVELGEFDGWVAVNDYYSNSDMLKHEEQKVIIKDNCIGFLWANKNDRKNVYIFTGLSHRGITRGKIYKFQNEESAYEVNEFVDLDAEPLAFLMDGEDIIVVTANAFLKVESDGKTETISDEEYWSDLCANSIVKHNECYYIGAESGILEYRINDGDITWYPYYDEGEE